VADEDLLKETCRKETVGVRGFTCHVSTGKDLSSGKSAATDDQACPRHDASFSAERGHFGWVGKNLQTPSLAFIRIEKRGACSAIDEAAERLLKVTGYLQLDDDPVEGTTCIADAEAGKGSCSPASDSDSRDVRSRTSIFFSLSRSMSKCLRKLSRRMPEMG
jgi:hypothetical protein